MENPTDHRDGHAVAERLITGSVRSGLTAVRDQRVIVGEALKALALARRQTTDGHGRGNPWRRVRIERPRWPFSREPRSEEHTSELQSLMRISYAVFCLKKKKKKKARDQV